MTAPPLRTTSGAEGRLFLPDSILTYAARMTTPAPRRIGVLTGGGDCPGLNAVIRAVTKDAVFHGIEVIGIEDGFLGLIEDRTRPLTTAHVSGILTSGGTILGTCNRANPLRFCIGRDGAGTPIFKDVSDNCVRHYRNLGLDAMVVIGGDGTMTCAADLASIPNAGINVIGIPKTIDNDLFGTDLTFGFTTAVATATEALDRVHTTAASHHRALFVEVMGRNAGWIALHSGIASGADIILVPEIPFSFDAVTEAISRRTREGKRYSVICVAEGARPLDGQQVVQRFDPSSPDPIRLGGVAKFISDHVEQRTGIECRYVVLGHVQRGGGPVAADRVLATQFGHHAMQLLRAGKTNRMVGMTGLTLNDVPIREPAGRQRLITMDHPLLAVARGVYTSFGV